MFFWYMLLTQENQRRKRVVLERIVPFGELYTHIHNRLWPSWILSRTTWVSRHQKGNNKKVKSTAVRCLTDDPTGIIDLRSDQSSTCLMQIPARSRCMTCYTPSCCQDPGHCHPSNQVNCQSSLQCQQDRVLPLLGEGVHTHCMGHTNSQAHTPIIQNTVPPP